MNGLEGDDVYYVDQNLGYQTTDELKPHDI